jgi:hypothetical protein
MNALKQAERNMKRYGNLLEDEAKAEAARTKLKEARAAAAKKATDDKLRLAASRQTLTEKAAGPYAGPEEVPLSWFLAEHPAPWMRWVIITPELATELMKRNTDNRPMINSTREDYGRIVEANGWRLTHQGGAMDRRGVLQDGQHRFQACIDTGKPIVMPFFVGMDPENFKAIDEGRNRRAADLFGKDGEVDVTLLSATVRLVLAYREPYPRAFLRRKMTNATIYDAFKGDPDRLATAVRWGRKNYQRAHVVGAAISAARYLMLEANGPDNQYVHAFFEGLAHGCKPNRMLLDMDDPRALARTVMENRRGRGKRFNSIEQVGILITAWNQLVAGRRGGSYLRWAETQQDIPSITVCVDKGHNASAPPEFLRGEFVPEESDQR